MFVTSKKKKINYFLKVSVNGRSVTVPHHSSVFEIDVYGAVIHEVKIPKLGFVLTFTPSINEFMLQLNPHVFSSSTSGLCGKYCIDTVFPRK